MNEGSMYQTKEFVRLFLKFANVTDIRRHPEHVNKNKDKETG